MRDTGLCEGKERRPLGADKYGQYYFSYYRVEAGL